MLRGMGCEVRGGIEAFLLVYYGVLGGWKSDYTHGLGDRSVFFIAVIERAQYRGSSKLHGVLARSVRPLLPPTTTMTGLGQM